MKKGYTLIELIVAMGIITLLLSLSFAGLGQVRVRSRDAKRIADLQTIQAALEHHALNDASRTYPPDPTTTDTTYCSAFQGGTATAYNGIYDNPCFSLYLSVTPKGPQGERYDYHRPGCIVADKFLKPNEFFDQDGKASEAGCRAKSGKYGSYGLHALLESDKNEQAKNDSSPADAKSYDLMP